MPTPEQVLHLAQEIVNAKAALAELEAKWSLYFPSQQMAAPSDHSTKELHRHRGPRSESMSSKIVGVLNADAANGYTMPALSVASGINNETQTRRVSDKLVQRGLIERRERGQVGARRYQEGAIWTAAM